MSTRAINFILAVGVVALGVAPCIAQDIPAAEARDDGAADAPALHIRALDYALEAPEVLPSGWSTIRFSNEGHETHFFLLGRLPDGKTVDDYLTEVAVPFDGAWQALREGEVDQEGAVGMLMQNVPEWFWTVDFLGGAGLTDPGVTTDVTVSLEPGTYFVECYMKTADGQFHSMEGMIRPLVVTDHVSTQSPPQPTLNLTLSNSGIDLEGDLTPGRHTIAVHVAEHPEMGFPHDVNLARIDDDTSVDEVVAWMSWMNIQGLAPPAPAKFLGGARPMPVGHTAYFTVDLEPGRYLLLSEATAHLGVLKEVRVAHH